MEGHIADVLKTRGPKLTQIDMKVMVNRVEVIFSLAVSNDAVRDQIDWIEVALLTLFGPSGAIIARAISS